jgi:hypothetical protein
LTVFLKLKGLRRTFEKFLQHLGVKGKRQLFRTRQYDTHGSLGSVSEPWQVGGIECWGNCENEQCRVRRAEDLKCTDSSWIDFEPRLLPELAGYRRLPTVAEVDEAAGKRKHAPARFNTPADA